MLETGRDPRQKRSYSVTARAGLARPFRAVFNYESKNSSTRFLKSKKFFNLAKSTLFCRAAVLATVTLLILFSVLLVGLKTTPTAHALPTNYLNFQARLLQPSGALVADGSYNIEFKLYNASSSSGSSQGSCTGDSACLWTETRTSTKVTVVNGFFSVNLGDTATGGTAFPSTIDWSSQLYLTMNIGGTSGPTWDGEMSPRIKLTAVPLAFVANNLASAPTSTASTNSSNISIQTGNATGTTSNSGNITLDVGTATSTRGSISIGTINAPNAITVGNTATALTLQGSSSSIFRVTNGANTSTLGFTTPTANQTYNLPNLAAGTYNICTNGSVCSGYAAATGAAGYIQNTTSLQTSANMYIQSGATGNTTATLKQYTSQTADILKVEASGSTTALSGIDANGNFYLGTTASLKVTGGATGSRPGSPTEGQVWFDTTTKQLITYANGKWQADRSTATKIVAANNSSQALKDAADYVATGTGDQTTINTALTAATGGKVYLAEGTYVTSAAISVPNNTTLAGAGEGTKIEFSALGGATTKMIQNTDQSTGTNVTVRDLNLDARYDLNPTGSLAGVIFWGLGSGTGASAVPGGRMINVSTKNFSDSGLYLYNSSNSIVSGGKVVNSNSLGNGVHISGSSNSSVTATIVEGASNGVYIVGSSSNNTINAVISQGNANRGVMISSSGTGNIITNSVITNNTGHGISIEGSNSNTVTGNNVASSSQVGINLFNASYNTVTGNNVFSNGSYGIVLNQTSNYNAVSSNQVKANAVGVGILASSTNNQLSNNSINSSTSYGITVNGSDLNTVSTNQLYDNGGSTSNEGIHLTTADNNQILYNSIYDSACSSNCYAIDVSNSGSDNNNLAGNSYTGPAGYPATINDAGTGTRYASQLTPAAVLQSGSSLIKANATSVITGSIDPTASTSVTGVGTFFTTELQVGDRITVSGETRTVTVITSATALTVDTAFSNNANDTSVDRLPAALRVTDSTGANQLLVKDNGVVVLTTLSSTNGTTQLCRNSLNELAGCDSTSSTSAFLNGGNGFTATSTLGNTGNFDLNVITNNTTRLTVKAGGDVAFDTNTLYIDSTNNRVGIGLTNPATPLEVVGAVRSSSTGGQGAFEVRDGGTLTANLYDASGAGNIGILDLYSAGTNTVRLRADSSVSYINSGNFGIGDTTPASLFTVGNGDLFQINSSGVVTAGTWQGGVVGAAYGGTGNSSYTIGDLLYASGATALSKLAAVATGSCLISQGTGTAPVWGSCAAGNTLQTAYNNSTNPEITVDATRGALTVRDNATPIGANLLEVQDNAGTTSYLAVAAASTAINNRLNVTTTYTGTTLAGGIVTAATLTPSSASSALYYGSYTTASSSSSNATGATLGGVYGEANFSGAALTIARVEGGRLIAKTSGSAGATIAAGNTVSVQNTGTGTIGNAIASSLQVLNQSTGTITQSIGEYIWNPSNASGTITRAAGLAIENQTRAGTNSNINLLIQGDNGFGTPFTIPSGTSNYSIYNASTYANYFEGGLSVGVATTGTSKLTVNNGSGTDDILQLQDNGTAVLKVVDGGHILGVNAATGTTGTTEATARTNVTTVTLTAAGSFANNDVIFINNAGQDYYTRITAGGGTTTLTVSPAVSYDVSAAVTKYTVQNLGATASDYTTQTQRLFQGYFLGGVVTGAGSTTFSDQNITSTGSLTVNTNGSNARLTVESGGNVSIDTNTLYVDASLNSVGIGTSSMVAHEALTVNKTFNSGYNCGFGCYGVVGSVTIDNPTSAHFGVGTFGRVFTANTSFTLSNAAALYSGALNKGAASTVTNNYGLYLENQTAGTNDYGVYIAGADTYSLWVDSGTSQFDGQVQIGTSDTTGTLLVLDTKTSSGDPTCTDGGMYYNSNSSSFRVCRAGSWVNLVAGVDVQKFTASGTWTKPTGVSVVMVIACGGGGGGGGGRGNTAGTGRVGGTAGGGGAFFQKTINAADVSSTVTVTVGGGGNGGASNAVGTAGSASTFGTYLRAGGGGAGSSVATGTATGGGGGGGINEDGGSGGATTNGTGGDNPSVSQGMGWAGGASSYGVPTAYNAEFGGGGGAPTAGTQVAGLPGSSSAYGGGGGGAGGAANNTNVGFAGGNGGLSNVLNISGGGGGAANTAGGAGGAGSSTSCGSGGGGGGGNGTGTGGAGGAGGAPGGGGGGGGAGTTGGTGGAGGRGEILVISW